MARVAKKLQDGLGGPAIIPKILGTATIGPGNDGNGTRSVLAAAWRANAPSGRARSSFPWRAGPGCLASTGFLADSNVARNNLQPRSTHQFCQRHPERVRDFDQRKHSGIVVPAFYAAKIASVNLGKQRETFLRNTHSETGSADCRAKGDQVGCLSAVGKIGHLTIIAL